MSVWALIKHDRIITAITTTRTRAELQREYPDYEVRDIHSLSPELQQTYQYWDERP